MAGINSDGGGLRGPGGVVVIDGDGASVRLVRSAEWRVQDEGGDLGGLEAQEVLMGFLRLTGRT